MASIHARWRSAGWPLAVLSVLAGGLSLAAALSSAPLLAAPGLAIALLLAGLAGWLLSSPRGPAPAAHLSHAERALTAARIGLALCDRSGRFLWVNEALTRMTGLEAAEHLGRKAPDIIPGLAGFAGLDEEWRRLLSEETPALCLETTGRARGPGVEPRALQQCWYPVHDGLEVVGLGATVEDVTERTRAEADRARLVSTLEDAIRARDEFLSIASHELRTPLTALQLQIERLDRALQGRIDERAACSLKSGERAINRLGRLVNNLLDVSMMRSDLLLLEIEEVDLCEAMRETAARMSEELERSGSQLVWKLPEQAVGRWDRQRVDQIATNLLSNAVKFGAGRPITVAVEVDATEARLTVTDAGLGIANEDLERIFKRFERAVSARHFGGLGLGLWIARQSAESLGGSIAVQSHPGFGSAFTVGLPLSGPVVRPGLVEPLGKGALGAGRAGG